MRLLKQLLRTLSSRNRVFLRFAEPGHFYSPLPDLDEISERSEEIFSRDAVDIAGVDLRSAAQLELVAELAPLIADLPFLKEPSPAARYFWNNSYFPAGDAAFLAALMRHYRPRRIVEVGSGFSSAVMLDVDERFLDGSVELTFIEPYPARLLSLLREGESQRLRIREERVQQVPLSVFTELRTGDMLFIDSSHAVRCGGDVNHLIFGVLPSLAPGVLVHVHDVLWPFEYPETWLRAGIAWSEAYLVRAFLQYNDEFEVLLFGSWLESRHRQELERLAPLTLERGDDLATPANASLWIRRRQ